MSTGLKFDDKKLRYDLVCWKALPGLIQDVKHPTIDHLYLYKRRVEHNGTQSERLLQLENAWYSISPRFDVTRTTAVACALTYGFRKYDIGNNPGGNWRLVPNAKERYFSAALRHAQAVETGSFYDLEGESPSLLPHEWLCLCNIHFLLAFEHGIV